MAEGDLGPDAQIHQGGFKVKDECASDGDEDCGAMVEEMLQQSDTAVIYPEAPEDEPTPQGTPEITGHDENGTPDAFSRLLTCPYCARGYKRYTSLKEHIKYRHEKNEDNFSCTLCTYTFTHRTQLDRHMTAHKSGREQRHVTSAVGNRKFKCTECGKAFKYKHHLKEHLRIHSGEKPYECSNCKKRFSHSGSYSSHISSKKCIGLIVNGRPRASAKGSQSVSPALPASPVIPVTPRMHLAEKADDGRPLQDPLPLSQIKSEPMDYEYKPVMVASGVNGVFSGNGTPLQAAVAPPVVQAVVLPTVGLVSPISINLSDLQNVLKVAVDGNMIRQVLGNTQASALTKAPGTAGQVQPGGPPVISAISLPIVDQDGTAKIIINYNLDPVQAQLSTQSLKKEPSADVCKAEKVAEDLTVKTEKDAQVTMESSISTCLLCEDKHHQPKHCKAQSLKVNGAEVDKADSTALSLLADGGLAPGQPPLKNLLSLLKAYYALNAEPTKEELVKISDSVSLPLDVVKKWFEKMHTGQISLGSSSPPPGQEAPQPEPDITGASSSASQQEQESGPSESMATQTDSCGELDVPTDSHGSSLRAGSPSLPVPLNLSAGAPVAMTSEEDTEEPLDLSLPKLPRGEADGAGSTHVNSVYSVQEEPLNLTCTKKVPAQGDPVDANLSPPSAKPINIVTTQLPTIVAITDQSSVPCLRALTSTSKTILIPQLAYTYAPSGGSSASAETPHKAAQANGSQEDTSSVEDQNDLEATPQRKRMRKTENGMYACDLCDKIFQKSSSLLRHKYEHTGKRPHECGICNKAFKHKHHLIEHMRLHSGEKPYQCDKCGKRFSHSGSYSQHMNHRYSYCKKEARDRGEGASGGDAEPREDAASADRLTGSQGTTPQSHLDSDERESSAREDEESEEEEEEEDEEELLREGGVNDDEIQVVRVGEDEEHMDSEEGEEEEEPEQGELGVNGGDVEVPEEVPLHPHPEGVTEMESAMETEDQSEDQGEATAEKSLKTETAADDEVSENEQKTLDSRDGVN